MQERGLRYHHKKIHWSDESSNVCNIVCVVSTTNRQNVDNVSAITSICDSSEINVETIYDREEILH